MNKKRNVGARWLKPLIAVLAALFLLFIGVKISTVIWEKYLDPDRTSSEEGALPYPTLPIITLDTDPESSAKTEPGPGSSADTAAQTGSDTAPDTTAESRTATEEVPGRVADTEYTGELQVPYTRMPGKYILTNKDFGIPDYKSPHDANGDGIDDQTQFVIGAKEFLAQDPQYKSSSYYQGGYAKPDAEGVIYGVCTDVIAFAFRAAGYDLKALIDADMAAHPENYVRITENFDPNINFRRVRTQSCFFLHHAASLTIDPYDYKEWQPGDIVVTGNIDASMAHICLVSTRRAEDGVPYVLQLATTGQTLFEEDYLTTCQLSEKSKPILAHFRYEGFNGQ